MGVEREKAANSDLYLRSPVRWVGGRFPLMFRSPECFGVLKQGIVWTLEGEPALVATDVVDRHAPDAEVAECLVDALREHAGQPLDPVGGLVAMDDWLAGAIRAKVGDQYDVSGEYRREPCAGWVEFRAGLGHVFFSDAEFLRWGGPSVARFLRAAADLYRQAPWDGPVQGVALVEMPAYEVDCVTTLRPMTDCGRVATFMLGEKPGPGHIDHGNPILLVVSYKPADQVSPEAVRHLHGLGYDEPEVVPVLGRHQPFDVLCRLVGHDFDVATGFCEGLRRVVTAGAEGPRGIEFVADELPKRPTVKAKLYR